MELIADGLLIAAASTAALYCWVLSRRLTALKNLDKGLGGAIASLSAQVDETRASLASAKSQTGAQTRELKELTMRADVAAKKLEIILTTVQKAKISASPGAKAQQSAAATEVVSQPTHAIRERREAPAKPIATDNIFKQGSSLSLDDFTQTTPSLEINREKDVTKAEQTGPALGKSAEVTKSALITRLRGLAEATAS